MLVDQLAAQPPGRAKAKKTRQARRQRRPLRCDQGGALQPQQQAGGVEHPGGHRQQHVTAGIGQRRAAFRDARELEKARSEENTSELQSLMRISYAVFCLKKKPTTTSKILLLTTR